MTQSPSVWVSVLYDSYVNDPAQQPVRPGGAADPPMLFKNDVTQSISRLLPKATTLCFNSPVE
jgi:hypothetical protein